MHPSPTASLCGPDQWLRPKLSHRLAQAGVAVRDLGPGSASIRDIDTLVYVPVMMPNHKSERSTRTAAAALTFAAAAQGKVGQVIVVSRVGRYESDPSLDALRRV